MKHIKPDFTKLKIDMPYDDQHVVAIEFNLDQMPFFRMVLERCGHRRPR